MTTIIGRLTADAQVKTIEEGKTVVNFTIALSDWYKPKGAAEGIEIVEFIQCGYWLNTNIANSLKKGALVEAGGRIFATGYAKGHDIKGQINLMAQYVKVHVFAKKDEPEGEEAAQKTEDETATQAQKTKGGNRKKNKQKPLQQQTPGQAAIQVPAEQGDDLPF